MQLCVGNFYFLSNEYFQDFSDPNLSQNKESLDGYPHSRPCFYAFKDDSKPIYWLIPISSRVEKYRAIYRSKIERYGLCDTLAFGLVLGHEKAFLIQNMCPATSDYIESEYMDKRSNIPVKVDGPTEKEIIQKAQKVLALTRQGFKLIFPDILAIEKDLII